MSTLFLSNPLISCNQNTEKNTNRFEKLKNIEKTNKYSCYSFKLLMVKNQYENEISIAKSRMIRLICGKIKWDKIRNDDIRKRIRVASTVEKIVGKYA